MDKPDVSPVLEIEELAQGCIERLFGVQAPVRVVRQNRKIDNSSLSHVDYAIPCFDLANIEGASGQDCARMIHEDLKKSSGVEGRFSIEANSGYLNFCIDDELLKSAVLLGVERFRAGNLSSIGPSDRSIVIQALEDAHFALDDSYQKCRDILFQTIKSMGWSIVDTKALGSDGLRSFVKSLAGYEDRGFVVDSSSQALYLLTKSTSAPIVSASGRVLWGGKVGEVAVLLASSAGMDAKDAWIISPYRLHESIKGLFQACSPSTDLGQPGLTCFDPRVSKTNIEALSPIITDVVGHLQGLAEVLVLSDVTQESRYELLAILDLPLMLQRHIQNAQIPRILDALHESYEILSARVFASIL